MKQFITPIVRVKIGPQILDFYSEQNYKSFCENQRAPFVAKYYKGLGTSTEDEGKSYMKNEPFHNKPFKFESDEIMKKLIQTNFDKNLPGD